MSEIQGWMTKNELQWLQAQSMQWSIRVEIGSWKGRSARALCYSTKGVLFCVDTFWGTAARNDMYSTLVSPFERDKIRNEFLENTIAERISGRLFLLEQTSREAAANPIFRHNRPDFVFIDGDHSFLGVSQDIQFWVPLMSHGVCRLAGHDVDQITVRTALQMHFPNCWKVAVDGIWYVDMPRNHLVQPMFDQSNVTTLQPWHESLKTSNLSVQSVLGTDTTDTTTKPDCEFCGNPATRAEQWDRLVPVCDLCSMH